MKTRDLITRVLKENGELDSSSIIKKLKEFERELTYETVMRYLKEMLDGGTLTRKGKKGPEDLYPLAMWEGKRTPWVFYYKLKDRSTK